MQNIIYKFEREYPVKEGGNDEVWKICYELSKRKRFLPVKIHGVWGPVYRRNCFYVETYEHKFDGYESFDRNDEANLQLEIVKLTRLFNEFCEEFAEQAREWLEV